MIDSGIFWLSWMFALSNGLLILFNIVYDRSLLIKPSFMAMVFFWLQVQIGSAISVEKIERLLSIPIEYLFVIHLFPLAVLILSLAIKRKPYRKLLSKITALNTPMVNIEKRAMFLFFITVFFTMWYLLKVPFYQTGLYIAIANPDLADVVREESFKLLSNPLLKYGFYFMSMTFAPLSVVFMYLYVRKEARPGIIQKLVVTAGIIAIVIFVSLYGARGPSGMVILVLLFAIYIRRSKMVNPFKIALFGFIVLLFPTLISFFKNGLEMNLGESFINILDRAMGRGFLTNAWYIDYFQRNGPFGIAGIPKLATIFGVESINTANLIALEYDPHALPTSSANSSFVVQYFSIFGYGGILLSLFLVLLLDYLYCFYRLLTPATLVACVSAMNIPIMQLSFTQFTAALLSKGLFLIIITSLAVDILFRKVLPFITRNGDIRKNAVM